MHLIWEWWGAMYGNVFAISIWTVVLFGWHHLRLKKHINAKHDELKAHVREHVSAIVRQLPGNDLSSGKEDS